jgi:hypothetical protein
MRRNQKGLIALVTPNFSQMTLLSSLPLAVDCPFRLCLPTATVILLPLMSLPLTVDLRSNLWTQDLGTDEEHDGMEPQHNAITVLGIEPIDLQLESDLDDGFSGLNDTACSVNVGDGNAIESRGNGPMIFEGNGTLQKFLL